MTLRQRLPPAFGHRHPLALRHPKPPFAPCKPVLIQSLAYIAESIGKNVFAWLKIILPRHAQTPCPTASLRAAWKPPFAPNPPFPIQSLAYIAVMISKNAFAWLKVILSRLVQKGQPWACPKRQIGKTHCLGMHAGSCSAWSTGSSRTGRCRSTRPLAVGLNFVIPS